MRTLSAKDLGFDCDFVARGETIYEVIELMLDHIDDHHHQDEWIYLVRDLDVEEEKHMLEKHVRDDNRSPI